MKVVQTLCNMVRVTIPATIATVVNSITARKIRALRRFRIVRLCFADRRYANSGNRFFDLADP
jgi:hypothetical protein